MHKITPGIAAFIYLDFPDGRRTFFVYLAEDKLPVGENATPDEFANLPLPVRAAINRHFGIVFSLPVEQRGDYLRNLQPIEVE